MTTVRVENHVPDFNAALRAALPKAVDAMGDVYVRGAVNRMQKTGGRAGTKKGQVWNVPSAPGQPPAKQSGGLLREIGRSNAGAALTCKVGTNYAIGKYMEFGANPRAKGKGLLAIPLTYEASRAGSPRNMPNLVLIDRKNGNPPILARVHSRGKKESHIEPMFVLVKQSHIAARPWLRPTMNDPKLRAEAQKALDDTVRNAVMKTARGAA